MKKIGILAIHGSVREHRDVLETLGMGVQEVRLPEDLEGISGIIIPGGESTAKSKLLQRFGLFELLQKKIKTGLPIWGTCAGAILLAKEVTGKNPPKTLAVMDIAADRNWYGAQRDSFVTPLEISLPLKKGKMKKLKFEGVFIRAPRLRKLADEVEVLAMHQNIPILLRQNNMLASAFHPELSGEQGIHQYFLAMCE